MKARVMAPYIICTFSPLHPYCTLGDAVGMEGLNYALHSSYDVISNSDLSETDTYEDSVDRLDVEGHYQTNSPQPQGEDKECT